MKKKQMIFLFLIFFSTHTSFSQNKYASEFKDWISGISSRIQPLAEQDTLLVEEDIACCIPFNIEQHIAELSCFPDCMGFLYDGPYYTGKYFRINLKDTIPNVYVLLFHVSGFVDFTRSLVLATFDSTGMEISSMIVASEDICVIGKNKEEIEIGYKKIQYCIEDNSLLVREALYERDSQTYKDFKDSRFYISPSGIILKCDRE